MEKQEIAETEIESKIRICGSGGRRKESLSGRRVGKEGRVTLFRKKWGVAPWIRGKRNPELSREWPQLKLGRFENSREMLRKAFVPRRKCGSGQRPIGVVNCLEEISQGVFGYLRCGDLLRTCVPKKLVPGGATLRNQKRSSNGRRKGC